MNIFPVFLSFFTKIIAFFTRTSFFNNIMCLYPPFLLLFTRTSFRHQTFHRQLLWMHGKQQFSHTLALPLKIQYNCNEWSSEHLRIMYSIKERIYSYVSD